MKAAFISGDTREKLEKVRLDKSAQYDESWVQEILFDQGDLLNPMEKDALDPIIPITREFPLQGTSSKVFLDIFGLRV